MINTRSRKWAALFVAGSLLTPFGNCLPENYFALSARNVAVALADNILAVAVNPVFEALFGMPADLDDESGSQATP